MRAEFLLEILKTPISKAKADELTTIISNSDFSIQELIDLTFHQEEQIGFRAAWILECLYIYHTERFLPHATYFLSRFQQQDNLSSRRHFGKILALMTSRKATIEIKQTIENYNSDELVETVFNWLIDDCVPVAVKSHCLNVLANLTTKHDWIKDELLATMNFLIDKESIAFYAKAKQIKKQLAKS